jgi:hypothetical protein
MSNGNLLSIARSYVAAGLSVLPVRSDGSKAPAIGEWKTYQKRRPTDDELIGWFGNSHCYGVAVVYGAASGGLECVDVDAPELVQRLGELLDEAAPGLREKVVRVKTPRDGRHLIYRCSTVEGNQKLAQRAVKSEVTDEQEAKKLGLQKLPDGSFGKIVTLIETRGPGGYALAPGSPVECHKLRRPYKLLGGSFGAIPTITPEEREIIMSCARSLNEFVDPRSVVGAPQRKPSGQGLRPGDDFNERGEARALLEKHGWTPLRSTGERELWARPGADHTSASLLDGRVLYVYSTNAWPLEAGRAYSPFGLFAHLEHDGDFEAAAKALAAQGYGEQRPSVSKVSETAVLPEMPGDWPDPQPLPDGLRHVPTLPAALIPESLRGWLADIAERLQIPLDFPTVPALVLSASIIGNQLRIRPKRRDDWTVTANLWGANVGRPGAMKSPAITEALKPARRLVKDAEADFARRLKAWEFDRTAAEARRAAVRDAMKKAAKAGKDLEAFRERMEEEEAQEPQERRYLANDSTVEKLGELLNQNPRGLLVFRDELTGWLRSLDDERRANDRAFFLEAWNGDGSYVYDRIGRGTLKIDCVTVSIFGGIQPGPLASYLRGALGYGEGDDGLMQRFQMMVYPDLPAEWRNVDRWPETEAKNRAFEVFRRLSEINPQDVGAEMDEEGRAFLRFADDAQELFAEWFTDLNRALRSGEFEHPALEAHFSKYKSLMPSLALIFHLCDLADGSPGAYVSSVSLPAAEMAAAWCEFLMEHAKRIYGLGIGATAMQARTLAAHLRGGDLADLFTAREVHRKGWAGLSSIRTVEETLDLLEDLHWLRSVQIQTGGRPKVQYLINPKVGGAGR